MGEAAKPRSYRLDDETTEQIRKITEEIGEGQQVAFSRMIEAYMLQKAKSTLKEDRETVEQFEGYTSILTRMYMNVIEEKQNMQELIRTEFQEMLRSKDEIIQDLQKKNQTLTENRAAAEAEVEALHKDNRDLSIDLHELKKTLADQENDFKEKLGDKDALNQTLSDSCAQFREKNAQMNEIVQSAKSVMEDRDRIAAEYEQLKLDKQKALADKEEELRVQIGELKQQMRDMDREKDAALLASEKSLLDLRRQHSDEVDQLKSEMQEKVDAYQQKYMELLERLAEGHRLHEEDSGEEAEYEGQMEDLE